MKTRELVLTVLAAISAGFMTHWVGMWPSVFICVCSAIVIDLVIEMVT